MPESKPFPRTYRPHINWESDQYIEHPLFAENARQYILAAELIYKDYTSLINYIEQSNDNKNCYSMRIYELFFRTCTEIEANMKAILRENHYIRYKKSSKKHVVDDWNMKDDYFLLNKTHHLSSYAVKFPNWIEDSDIIRPFYNWKDGDYKPLIWYQDFTKVKHNRHEYFNKANFGNLVSSLGALAILLTTQFNDHDFSPEATHAYGYKDPLRLPTSVGLPLQLVLPYDWDDDEKYSFSWFSLRGEENPFEYLFGEYNNGMEKSI